MEGDTFMLKISENISRRRKEKNITQEELADFMMVTKASVSKWETGQSYPDILLLPKLATFFNITIDELVGYEPQLSTEQIRKVYENFINDVAKEKFEDVIKKVQLMINQYYSCFELLYYMGVFIVNHHELDEDVKKRQEYLEYANKIFKRICDSSNDSILKNKSLNMRGACLLQLGQAKEVIDILPSSDELIMSTDCLVAAASLQVENEDSIDKKLQVFIYKNVADLVTLLMMKSTLRKDDWHKTLEKVEDMIDTFNLSELNASMVLNFYLSLAIHYNKEDNLILANKYIEKYLNMLVNKKTDLFEIKGDQYFNKIEEWIEENLIMGAKPNRNKNIIYDSYLNAVIENKELEKVIAFDNTKKLIDKLIKNKK